MIKDFIVIGAGLSGLNTARKIKEMGLGSVLLLEKSRGVGGRMATRRTLETKFDHGAQFYRLKSDILSLHKEWKQKSINHQWFVSVMGDHWCAKAGMTAFPKEMATGLDVSLEKEIKTVDFENNLWKLTSNKNEEWFCHNLIISSPLPQTVKLLDKLGQDGILNTEILAEIKRVQYTKALIGLVTLEENYLFHDNGYAEFQAGDIFSISDQRKKDVSAIPAVTITMSEAFSEKEFESSDEDILKKILISFIAMYPNAKIKNSELKKWRYCQPKSQSKALFAEIAPKLFLIGDAFGGSSLLGALRSSDALYNFFLNRA